MTDVNYEPKHPPGNPRKLGPYVTLLVAAWFVLLVLLVRFDLPHYFVALGCGVLGGAAVWIAVRR